MGVARRGAEGLRSRGGGGLARASGRALSGGCPFQAAVQPGLPSAPATPPARVPSALGLWGAVWPPSVDVSTLPRRDPARLTPACPSRGPQAIRVRDEGTVLVAFCRRPPCGRSRGFRRSLRHARARPARASAPGTRVLFVGPAAHTAVRGSGCPRGNRRGHEGAARAVPAHGWQRLPVGPFRGPRPSVVEASSSFSHVRVTCEDASLSLSRSPRLRCSRLRFSRHPSEPHLAPGDKRGLPRGPARARRRVLHGRFSQNASPAHLWWRDAGPRAANTCPVADGASGKNRAEGARWSPDQGTKRR